MSLARPTRRCLLLSVALALCGCASRDALERWPEPPADIAVGQSSGGAIFHAGHAVALFENSTARSVGDILTIRLVERTNAVKSANTSTQKSTSIDLPGPTIAGRPVTHNGTEILETAVENETTFEGSGASSQSNRLEGNVAVTVIRRFGNGNLLVRGEKWLTLNQGRELVRIQGVVRAIDVEPDNTVPSWKVANASITYAGRGALANANAPGLLARFFNSPLLPF